MKSIEVPHYSNEQLKETSKLDNRKIEWWKDIAFTIDKKNGVKDGAMIDMWKRFSSLY